MQDLLEYHPTTMGIFRSGRIHPFNSPADILKFGAISPLSRLRFALSSAMLVYMPAYADAENAAAVDWLGKWAGAAATENIWAPMLKVKFGEAFDRVPLAWMAGRLRQRSLSRKGAGEQLGYITGSLEVLVDKLVKVLESKGVEILLNTTAEKLETENRKVKGIRTSSGFVEAPVVLSTVPPPILAGLVDEAKPEYSKKLEAVKYTPAVCTVLALEKQLSPVYWMNVADPGYDFGGVIEHTNFVPTSQYNGNHIVYLVKYFLKDAPQPQEENDSLSERQVEQLSRMFEKDVKKLIIDKWVFSTRFASPRPSVGFHKLIPSAKSPLDGLYTGCMCHIYPDERSVNNSIRVAAEVASKIGIDTSDIPRGGGLACKYGFD